jgi:hypothetical protein
MSVRKQKTRSHVNAIIGYGIGGTCSGRFPREAVEGLSAQELIRRVVNTVQPPGSAARTAAVLDAALRCRRQIDLELARAAHGSDVREGLPIMLHDVVIPKASGAPETQANANDETVTLMVSENYRGGQF